VPYPTDRERDRPWVMRTYAGHSSAAASNELYRRNLAKGQTGLSVAFDLPTQTGYDPDHQLSRGEVGKVGVPVSHIGDMRRLFDGIPLAEANTSMTINAPAMWLLALYVSVAREQAEAEGRDVDEVLAKLTGTTQNDIIKEYLSRGTYIFPPGPSLRLITDMIAWTVHHVPKWNPINICSYHLQEAGATPTQEVAYALCTAIAVLDAVRDSGQVDAADMAKVVARISFFVNAGVRFVEEMSKMRAFTALWDELTRDRYGVTDPKARRLRYGVQVNSLGLTEAQPRSSCPRGTRRSACPGRGTSSGRCGCSRCSRSRRTCWSTRTSSTARTSSRPKWTRSWPARARRSRGCRTSAARSPRSRAAT
jgi:(2R)-ethylmalonyl-CoA mutase